MLQIFTYALRNVGRERGSTIVALICLSVAIGTNTTVFSIVNGLLLRQLPVPQPDRLVVVQERRHDNPSAAGPVSYATFQDLRTQASDIVELAAERRAALRLSDGGPPERHAGSLASWNFFRVLGVQPSLGRDFVEADGRPAAPPVVILSHSLWQERYGGERSIVGRTIIINGTARTVVGVLPRGASHVALRGLLGARLWIPLGAADEHSPRDQRRLRVYGRLHDGVDGSVARSRLETAARGLELRFRENKGWGVAVEQLRTGFSPATTAMLAIVTGAVSFVLLMACANVANLTLVRVSSRQHELATCLALGASGMRLVAQLVTENLIVALTSVPPGILLAFWGRSLLIGSAGPDIYESTSIDFNVLMFTAGLAGLASVLTGLLPAAYSVRHLHVATLAIGRRSAGTGGLTHVILSRVLIASEVALATILLVGALLFLQSFRATLRAEGGFDTSRILTMVVETADDFEQPGALAAQRLFAIIDRLDDLPGVGSAAAANFMPLRDGGARVTIITDANRDGQQAAPSILFGGVTSRFFEVVGIPLVQGRPLSDTEVSARTPVAVINRRMAERMWPGESALGRRFRPAGDSPWFTVVGISDNILTWDLSNRPLPTAYVPYSLVPDRDPRVFLRTYGEPRLAAQSARAAINDLAPSTPILDMATMTEVHRLALGRNQTLARLFAVLGSIALILGAAGVYGVLSYFVSQRNFEIGIRAALGASPRSVVVLFAREGLVVGGMGLALGLPSAWIVTRLLRARLYNVSAPDPWIFVGVSVVLIAVAFGAAYGPARRAAAVDPLTALRQSR